MALAAIAFAAAAPQAASETPAGEPARGAFALLNDDATLRALVAEALDRNPEIRAARAEAEAARNRISPAGALDDPMLEMGLVNVPTNSWRLGREDMTMRMLGLSQRLPGFGKRALRREVAGRDAEMAEQGYRELANRVARETRLAYYELAAARENVRLATETAAVLGQFLAIVETRYALGQAAQADVLKAQTQLARMREELLRMERERALAEAELARLTGRGAPVPVAAELPALPPALELEADALRQAALRGRPQLVALQRALEKADAAIELARREESPDFELRLQYGWRENMPDGTKRPDVASFLVVMNLPIWRAEKIAPRIAETRALRAQAANALRALDAEIVAKLRQQVAIAEQSLRSAELYERAILPQARLAVESSLAAYRVGRVDFLALLDSQMSVYSYGIARTSAHAAAARALAEIAFLTGAQEFPEGKENR